MYPEIVGTILASLGGATLIVGGFAHWLGKVWAERIAKQTQARYEQELEALKSQHTMALEDFKRKADFDLKDFEYFGGISKEVYQDFFRSRIETYIKLLELKNKFISTFHEDASIDEMEAWGEAYYSSYTSFKETLIKSQLYISNELENVFHELRMEASEYVRKAELIEIRSISRGANDLAAYENKSPAYDKLASNTYKHMLKLINQIDSDVAKLRSRIDLDKPELKRNN